LHTTVKKPQWDPANVDRYANAFNVSNVEHLPALEHRMIGAVKANKFTLRQILRVLCPDCGAAIGKFCDLDTDALRTEPDCSETKPDL